MSEDWSINVTPYNYPKILRGNQGTPRCQYKTKCKNW